jgi:hypothetical protein
VNKSTGIKFGDEIHTPNIVPRLGSRTDIARDLRCGDAS